MTSVDVSSTLRGLGISGHARGDEFVAECPMHYQRTGKQDSHPSWSINLNTGLFLCFSCGYKGSIITLISDLKGVTFDEAKILTVKPDINDSIARIPGPQPIVSHRQSISESQIYRFSPPPKWALRRRHLSPEACDLYGVRWNFNSESWILPIRNPTDNALLGWQEKSEVDRMFRNYPLGVKKSGTLFGYQAFTGGRMVVVESPLDAVRIQSDGIAGAVATYGAIVSKLQLLLMSAADEVVFALDNPFKDAAGRKSSIELLKDTQGVLRSVRFFNYNDVDAKDPGDMTVEQLYSGLETAKSRAFGKAALGGVA